MCEHGACMLSGWRQRSRDAGQPGGLGDVLDRRVVIAPFLEQAPRAFEQALPRLLFFAFPPGGGFHILTALIYDPG